MNIKSKLTMRLSAFLNSIKEIRLLRKYFSYKYVSSALALTERFY